MKMIKFNYKILPDKFTNGTKKPIVRVTLRGNNQTPLEVIGLLDSGADVSVIPKGLADYLNLKLGPKDISKGIGGEISIQNSSFQITVQQKHEIYHFENVPVQVAEDDTMPIIIGRKGFFDKFIVIIDEAKEVVRLKRKVVGN